jgi:hypothetical protein
MRCVKMNRTGEVSRSTKRRCCHLWGPKALQRHPFPGVRFRRGALTHWPLCSSAHCAEIRLVTRAAASSDLRSPRPIGPVSGDTALNLRLIIGRGVPGIRIIGHGVPGIRPEGPTDLSKLSTW